MYEGNRAQLNMQTLLTQDLKFDPETYQCTVLYYEKEREQICLLLNDADLQNIVLDAEYTCQIITEPKAVSCKGFVVSRHQDERGNILCFQIKAGFYEINIK